MFFLTCSKKRQNIWVSLSLQCHVSSYLNNYFYNLLWANNGIDIPLVLVFVLNCKNKTFFITINVPRYTVFLNVFTCCNNKNMTGWILTSGRADVTHSHTAPRWRCGHWEERTDKYAPLARREGPPIRREDTSGQKHLKGLEKGGELYYFGALSETLHRTWHDQKPSWQRQSDSCDVMPHANVLFRAQGPWSKGFTSKLIL